MKNTSVRPADRIEKIMDTLMELPDKAPYTMFEQVGIHTAKIVDVNGKAIEKDITSELAEVQDGKVIIRISFGNVPSESYKLQISELVGSAKADQPLVLHGDWECEFTR